MATMGIVFACGCCGEEEDGVNTLPPTNQPREDPSEDDPTTNERVEDSLPSLAWQNPWAEMTLGEWATYATQNAAEEKWTLIEADVSEGAGEPMMVLMIEKRWTPPPNPFGEAEGPQVEAIPVQPDGDVAVEPWFAQPRPTDPELTSFELANGTVLRRCTWVRIGLGADGEGAGSRYLVEVPEEGAVSQIPLDGVLVEERDGREIRRLLSFGYPE